MEKVKQIVLSFVLGFLLGVSASIIAININQKTYYHIQYHNYGTILSEIKFPIVAVTNSGKGILEYGYIKMIPGNGKAYIRLNPFIEPDTQYSFETAIKVACKLSNTNCNKYDFILEIESNAELVGGPSAGAAMTLAAYALINNKTLRSDFAITGTIESDGSIGPVGGIYEKALAAAEAGKKIFLVPKGQSVMYIRKKIEKHKQIAPGFVIIQIEYIPVKVDLKEYFKENYGMEIIEVSNISEALNIVLKD